MTILCVSCRTTVEYIEKPVYYVPELNFPEFPVVSDYDISEDGEKVTVESDYFRKILIFRTQYRSLRDRYNEIKDLYCGGDDK